MPGRGGRYQVSHGRTLQFMSASPLIAAAYALFVVELVLLLLIARIERVADAANSWGMLLGGLAALLGWLSAAIMSFNVFGLIPMIAGILFFGVGVVPLGMVAAVVESQWGACLSLGFLVIVPGFIAYVATID